MILDLPILAEKVCKESGLTFFVSEIRKLFKPVFEEIREKQLRIQEVINSKEAQEKARMAKKHQKMIENGELIKIKIAYPTIDFRNLLKKIIEKRNSLKK